MLSWLLLRVVLHLPLHSRVQEGLPMGLWRGHLALNVPPVVVSLPV